MATILHALTVLSEDSASRRAGLPFLVASLQANGWELELDAAAAETAATIRASPLGRLFARLAELAQSSVVAEVEDASTLLAACMAAGACGEKGLEAFWKQWTTCVTAFLLPRQGWTVRGRGCSCFAFILHSVHAVGKDTHVGREVSGALTGLLPSLVRVLEGAGAEVGEAAGGRAPDAAAAALGTALCLEVWRALLVFTPQAVRPHAHRLTARCLADLDWTRGGVLSEVAQQVLALLCYQLPDLPLSSVYCDSLTNSILLLLHVGLPVAARLGVGLGHKPAPEAALALPPIRCTPEEVLARFKGLFGALAHLLVHPAFVKPGTALPVDVTALLRVVANVCCLRAPTLDAKAHFGVDAASRLETLTPIGYSQLLAPLKALALGFLADLVPTLGSHVFVCRRDLAMCILESLGFACPTLDGRRSLVHPGVAEAAFRAFSACVIGLGAGAVDSIVNPTLPFMTAVVRDGLDAVASGRQSAARWMGVYGPPAAAACRAIQSSVLTCGPLLPATTREALDAHVAVYTRFILSHPTTSNADLRRELLGAVSASSLVPTASGAHSAMVGFAALVSSLELDNGCASVAATRRLGSAALECVVHPSSVPLAFPSSVPSEAPAPVRVDSVHRSEGAAFGAAFGGAGASVGAGAGAGAGSSADDGGGGGGGGGGSAAATPALAAPVPAPAPVPVPAVVQAPVPLPSFAQRVVPPVVPAATAAASVAAAQSAASPAGAPSSEPPRFERSTAVEPPSKRQTLEAGAPARPAAPVDEEDDMDFPEIR